MTEDLLKKYIEIVQSDKRKPSEITAYEFSNTAGIGRNRAKHTLEEWVREGLWSKREVPHGDNIIVYYEPLK